MMAAIDGFEPDILEDRRSLNDAENTTAEMLYKNITCLDAELKKTPIKRRNSPAWKFCVEEHSFTHCGG